MKHYLGICLVLTTIAVIVLFTLHSCTSAVGQSIDHVRDAFAQVFNIRPQITVNQRVVLAQTVKIAELAVVSKDELVTIGLNEHLEVLSVEIPLTEKSLTVEATFRLKAGFDLSEPFSVEIDPATHAMKASMPHAKILSVERIGELTYHGEDALLNRVTDAERSEILTNLDAAARDAAEKSSLKTDAEQQVSDRLREIINHNGESFAIKWTALKTVPTSLP